MTVSPPALGEELESENRSRGEFTVPGTDGFELAPIRRARHIVSTSRERYYRTFQESFQLCANADVGRNTIFAGRTVFKEKAPFLGLFVLSRTFLMLYARDTGRKVKLKVVLFLHGPRKFHKICTAQLRNNNDGVTLFFLFFFVSFQLCCDVREFPSTEKT